MVAANCVSLACILAGKRGQGRVEVNTRSQAARQPSNIQSAGEGRAWLSPHVEPPRRIFERTRLLVGVNLAQCGRPITASTLSQEGNVLSRNIALSIQKALGRSLIPRRKSGVPFAEYSGQNTNTTTRLSAEWFAGRSSA
jgi:hypothetical protein